MRIVFTGGGTGGHIYPLIAVNNYLRTQCTEYHAWYIGKYGGMEEGVARKNDLSFYGLKIAGLYRKRPWQIGHLVYLYLVAIIRCVIWLRRLRPRIVFATGGYVCFPACIAATLVGVPYCLHEQNALPGKANQWLARRAHTIFLAMPGAADYFPEGPRVVQAGLPIRQVFHQIDAQKLRSELGYAAMDQIILITGGSRGSQFLNNLALLLFPLAAQSVKFILITGQNNFEQVLGAVEALSLPVQAGNNVVIMAYADSMETYMSVANLVICRAGATTIGELCALGKPSILVPYPEAAENHQHVNALAMESAGAALMLEEENAGAPEDLLVLVEGLLNNQKKLETMSRKARGMAVPGADKQIADYLIQISKASDSNA